MKENWAYNYYDNVYGHVQHVINHPNKPVNPVAYRIDPETGLKAFDYNIPNRRFFDTTIPYSENGIHFNDLKLSSKELSEERKRQHEHNKILINKFFPSCISKHKPERERYNSKEAYETALFYRLEFNIPKSRQYWLQRRDKSLKIAVGELLENIGDFPNVIGKANDEGIDIEVRVQGIAKPIFEIVYIQCKGYKELLGPNAVREILGVYFINSRNMDHKKNACIVCPRGFTDSAKRLAKKHDVILLDADSLVEIAHGNADPFFEIRERILTNPIGKKIQI